VSRLTYLSIGSNRGDRLGYIKYSVERLGLILKSLSFSRIYETDPVYYLEQPKFLNAVVSGYFSGTPYELLNKTQEIEKEAGRNRSTSVSRGPRTLDIDIVLFGNEVVKSPLLTIPHPGLKERKFVLLPLLELNPVLKDPATNTKLWELFIKLENQGIYLYNTRGKQ